MTAAQKAQADKSAKRHQKVAGHWIDYGFSPVAGIWGYMVAFTGNFYAHESDAVAYARSRPR